MRQNQRELSAVKTKIQVRNEASNTLDQTKEKSPNEEEIIAEINRDIEKLNSEIEYLFNKYLMREIKAYTGKEESAIDTLQNALKFRRQQTAEEEEEDDSDDDSWLDD